MKTFSARLLGAVVLCLGAASAIRARELTFEQRVEAQRAIERVYWSHRIWPKENQTPKPPLEAVMSDAAIRARVEDDLKLSNALEAVWHRPLTRDQLQAEMDRMAVRTRDPKMLRDLFASLGDDPFLIAETLARRTLVGRLARDWYGRDTTKVGKNLPFEQWWAGRRSAFSAGVATRAGTYRRPVVEGGTCEPDTWRPTFSDVPDARSNHTMVWTGSEAIVWGGEDAYSEFPKNTGARFDPSTDTWLPTSVGANVPTPRRFHTAVWTGTEMIVWGGDFAYGSPGTGARYDPVADVWHPITTTDAPISRDSHTAVWTGTEMIVWGGVTGSYVYTDTGGRYDPSLDRWIATATGGPSARAYHSALWTGTEMLLWGGAGHLGPVNTGSRYDPSSDTWRTTSTGTDVPDPRAGHSAIWTGSEMLVWGGSYSSIVGARYDPASDTWRKMSTLGQPAFRVYESAVWTGTELIIWGGLGQGAFAVNTGGRYDPASDAWTATSTGDGVPFPAVHAAAIWTGTEMIVWGGDGALGEPSLGTGGRYAPASDSWVPTPTVSATVPSARAGHAGIWTGAEMIVWGGWESTIYSSVATNTGGRYSPALDSWVPTSIQDAPAVRANHVARWTGSEMIVWGGENELYELLSSGGRYDPTMDRWRPTAPSGAPDARTSSSAIWTGSEMIVWGGLVDPLSYPRVYADTGARYDPSSDTWTETTTLDAPAARVPGAVVWTGTEMIVWGGYDFDTGRLQTGGRYDPHADRWSPTSLGADVPTPRESPSYVWTGTELVVWGSGYPFYAAGGAYDPATDRWRATTTVNAPAGRHGSPAVWTGTAMLVWDQDDGSPSGGSYDPAADTWSSIAADEHAPPAREAHTAVWTGSEMIVWGGFPLTATGGLYCPATCPEVYWFQDADGDGYGNRTVYQLSCEQPAGYVASYDDCNDTRSGIHPGAFERRNGLDDDCDGRIDERFGTMDVPGVKAIGPRMP